MPAYATAPALFFVACLMLRELTELDWDDTTEVIPAAVTALTMPFTYSIANGLAFGFITYAVLKLFTGRPSRCTGWCGSSAACSFSSSFTSADTDDNKAIAREGGSGLERQPTGQAQA